MKIAGYKRDNGTYGIRNHIVIIPTSVCASETATRISQQVQGSVALGHQHGCCQVGEDYKQTLRTLIGLGKNPNVAAVLVIGLGCEGIRPDEVAHEIKKSQKPVEMITIQGAGGTLKAIEEGTKIARRMAQEVSQLPKVEFDISELMLGIECGGSDPTSGICANPAVGVASDTLIELGGSAILSETTEFIGAEHILAQNTVSEDVSRKLLDIVERMEQRAISMGNDIRGTQPTPGNIQGGLSTIEEKSLGCIYKAGSAPVQDVVDYGEEVTKKGLTIMDTPGQDIDSITGMLAGGAQIIVFTTGRGTPTGSPIAPVIKVTGNSKTYNNMIENIDINAGQVIDDDVSLQEMGQEIFEEMIQVSKGKLTKAEILGHREFAITRIGYTF